MLVRLTTSLVWEKKTYTPGDDIELPDELARKYIAAGSAEPIMPPIETAALRTTAPKGKQNVRNAESGA